MRLLHVGVARESVCIMSIANLFDQNSGISRSFLEGMQQLEKKDYAAALECFKQSLSLCGDNDSYLHTYLSYMGLTQVMCGHKQGIKYCRRAAHFEKYNGNVYYNLALSELALKNRKRAVEAIHGGLAIEADHQDLLRLRQQIGVRERPAIRFFGRDHFINRFLGRRRRHHHPR